MERQQTRSDWTLASWVALVIGTMLACSLPLFNYKPGIMEYMWGTLGAMLVALLAPVSGMAGILFGLLGERATKTAGATSAMAAVWANVTFVVLFVGILVYRMN